jgi:hypothetical protein
MPVFILIALLAMVGLRYGVGIPSPPPSTPPRLSLRPLSRRDWSDQSCLQIFGNARARNLSFWCHSSGCGCSPSSGAAHDSPVLQLSARDCILQGRRAFLLAFFADVGGMDRHYGSRRRSTLPCCTPLILRRPTFSSATACAQRACPRRDTPSAHTR